jgi:hypothetical protein
MPYPQAGLRGILLQSFVRFGNQLYGAVGSKGPIGAEDYQFMLLIISNIMEAKILWPVGRLSLSSEYTPNSFPRTDFSFPLLLLTQLILHPGSSFCSSGRIAQLRREPN